MAVSEALFPSGPWTGFYTYTPQDKHRMDLHLTFANGHMSGSGNDDVGAFVIKGRYDAANLECHWTKTYVGAHEVYYQGYREGKGIWGRWEITAFEHGGFHIWPQGAEQGAAAETTEEKAPIEQEQPAANVPVVRALYAKTMRPDGKIESLHVFTGWKRALERLVQQAASWDSSEAFL